MARITPVKKYVGGQPPSLEDKSLAKSRKKSLEKNDPTRLVTPEIPAQNLVAAQGHARRVSQQFEDYVNAKDLSDANSQRGYANTLPGFEDWDKQTTAEVSQRRTAETRGAAQALGGPTKWEEFTPQFRKSVLSKLSAYGVTPQSSEKAFSAQVAQGINRSPQIKQHLDEQGYSHGETGQVGDAPYASGFYHEMGSHPDQTARPRQQIQNTADAFRVPYHVVATVHALLSPQLPFEEATARGTFHHNDDAARHAMMLARSSYKDEDLASVEKGGKITKESLSHLHPNARPVDSMARAALTARKLIRGETSMGSFRGGNDIFGDKTGAYAHAFLDPNSPDAGIVADTHTGSGFAPHLPKASQKEDRPRNLTQMLNIPGVHAFLDHIGKKVMAKHGLENIHWTQAAQWGEQRVNYDSQQRLEDAYVRRNVAPGESMPAYSSGLTSALTTKKSKVKTANPPARPDQPTLF
jgi:hypothetical protein